VFDYQVSKREFQNWLIKMQEEYEVWAPVKVGKNYTWGSWDGGSFPDEDYQNTLKPPKDLFFPQYEVLLKYKKVKGKRPLIIEPDLPQEKRIIWEVRPCDARSLTILDRVFINKDYEDPYYSHRRKNTVVISLVCQKPGLGCFCKDPLTTEGSDLMLLDCGDTYLVKLVSVKGKGLIKNPVFTADKPINIPMELPANPFNLEIADKDLAEKLEVIYRSPLWRELQEKCVNCGVCTFLCPTCHCFDLTDDQKGKKVRSWDSCMFASFTKQASGHNPRPTGAERLRQRVMHKFRYFFENHGIFACVGCGRCVEKCPVNLDIREVLQRIKEVQ